MTKTAKNATLVPSTLLPAKPADPTVFSPIAETVLLMLVNDAIRVSGGKVPAVLVRANPNVEMPVFNQVNNATTELPESVKLM